MQHIQVNILTAVVRISDGWDSTGHISGAEQHFYILVMSSLQGLLFDVNTSQTTTAITIDLHQGTLLDAKNDCLLYDAA